MCVFGVSGATGKTGKRIVEQLLAKGFAVKAGVRDAEKAKLIFPNLSQDLQIVKADVTEVFMALIGSMEGFFLGYWVLIFGRGKEPNLIYETNFGFTLIVFLGAMILVWQYGEISGYESWKGLLWSMVPLLLGGAFCACAWHFFYNSESLEESEWWW
ncbi:hypothetical protein L1887_18642 [Cichorium endivia]|nr:hypothetical protein L1887_18642 [Cichorium endivia]